jgi:hypothetical protein
MDRGVGHQGEDENVEGSSVAYEPHTATEFVEDQSCGTTSGKWQTKNLE